MSRHFEQVAVRGAGWPRLARAAGLCALIGLAGCGGKGSADNTPAAPVTATVGAAGGALTGPGDARLAVPAQALEADTAITIAQTDAGAPPLPALPAGFKVAGPVLALTPHGTSFGVPATLSLPRGTPGADDRYALLKTNAQGDGWEQLPSRVESERVLAPITGFSYAVQVSYTYCGSRCTPPGPPVISGQPRSGSVDEGGYVLLWVDAVGVAPFTYQWSGPATRDWRGQTGRALVLNPVGLADDGMRVSVTVTDAVGQSVISNAATISVRPVAPRVASVPADVQAVAGSAAQFLAGTTSSIAQTLQWERSESAATTWTAVNLPTAQSARLSLPPVTLADDGARYRLRATNSAGTVITPPAWLRVVPAPTPPVVLAPPADAAAVPGRGAEFGVQAVGGDLDFEWQRRDGSGTWVPVGSGGNGPVYTLSNTSPADDAARFRVVVRNPAGEAISGEALLSVPQTVGAMPVRVAGGGGHSVGLRGDGRLFTWGRNHAGQTGQDRGDEITPPRSVLFIGPAGTPLPGVATFAAGTAHTLVLLADGSAWGFGGNALGQLALDAGTTRAPAPVPLFEAPGLGTALAGRALAAGGSASMLLGSLAGANTRAWGSGLIGDGQVHGPGPTATSAAPALPTALAGASRAVRAAMGGSHQLAILADGNVVAWGANAFCQLGTGDCAARLEPAPVPALRDVVQVAAGGFHSMALSADGRVFAWGSNERGQLGVAPPAGRTRAHWPAQVVLPGLVVAIAAGYEHSLALTADGRLFAWGANGAGQVGDGSSDRVVDSPREVTAAWSGRLQALGAGDYHSLVLDEAGTVWAWGWNQQGQLGDGTTVDRNRPIAVPGVNLRAPIF